MATVTKSEDKVRDYLRERIMARYGSLAEYARKKEVAPSYIANVLRGIKPVPDWLLQGFKVKKTVDISFEIPK